VHGAPQVAGGGLEPDAEQEVAHGEQHAAGGGLRIAGGGLIRRSEHVRGPEREGPESSAGHAGGVNDRRRGALRASARRRAGGRVPG
jgi:hypothetical protein